MSRVFDNYPASYHDEIASYYPAWYRDVFEMDAVWQAAGTLLDTLRSDIYRVLSNAFIHSADEYAIARLETFLGIVSAANASLSDRRAFISALYLEHGGVSAAGIRALVRELTGYDSNVTLAPPALDIDIKCIVLPTLAQASLTRALLRTLPAHLQYSLVCTVSVSRPAYVAGIISMGGNITLMQTI